GSKYFEQSDFVNAAELYRFSLESANFIANARPGDLDAKYQVTKAQNASGETASKVGDLADAASFFRSALVMRETLVTSQWGNIEWKVGLAYSRERLASVLKEQSKPGEAAYWARAAIALLEKIKDSAGNLTPEQQRQTSQIMERAATLK